MAEPASVFGVLRWIAGIPVTFPDPAPPNVRTHSEVTCVSIGLSIFNVHEGRNGFGLWNMDKRFPKPRNSAFLVEPRNKKHVTG